MRRGSRRGRRRGTLPALRPAPIAQQQLLFLRADVLVAGGWGDGIDGSALAQAGAAVSVHG